MHSSDLDPNLAPNLGCVALPVVTRDIGQPLNEVFALWEDTRFHPGADPATRRPHLMVVANQASPEQLARAEALFHARPGLASSFSGISAHSADLSGDQDIYAPDGAAQAAGFGRKAGPNFLFQRLIELAAPQCARRGGFVLQLELDCLPVAPDWIGATNAVINDHPTAWVIGSTYAGRGLLGADAKSHLNGNALYRVGDAGFRRFFARVWMPRLLHQIASRADLAYDWWWAVERHEADARADNQSWRLFQTYDHFFHNDPYIVNLAVPRAGVQAYRQVFDRVANLTRAPVFLHGPAMKEMRARLLQHPHDSLFEAIDRIDPPQSPAQNSQPPQRPDPADDTLAPDRLLLQAAAALLAQDNDAIKALSDPHSPWFRALAMARETLGETHPACIHFDRVRTYVKPR